MTEPEIAGRVSSCLTCSGDDPKWGHDPDCLMWRAECERRSAADLAAAGRVFTPQEVMERARYGEPTDTYTWNLVVARCLQHLAATGFVIVRAEEKPDD